jgi:hypothetical protein
MGQGIPSKADICSADQQIPYFYLTRHTWHGYNKSLYNGSSSVTTVCVTTFGRSRVKISEQIPGIHIEIYCDFPQPLHENVGKQPYIRQPAHPFTYFAIHQTVVTPPLNAI